LGGLRHTPRNCWMRRCRSPMTTRHLPISEEATGSLRRRKDESARSVKIARALFEALGTANPYDVELAQMAKLFEADVSSGDDIALLLFALEQGFGYQAYSTGNSAQQEIDDLGNRIRDYRNVLRFLRYENELRIAHEYAQHELPEAKELQPIQAQQKDLAEKLADFAPGSSTRMSG